VDGNTCPMCTLDGVTETKVYVTLEKPREVRMNGEVVRNANEVFLTSLHLAVSKDGATDAQSAFESTWAKFEPKNITTWQGDKLYYYRNDPGHVKGFDVCALSEEQLLISRLPAAKPDSPPIDTEGSGQCGAFAFLLMGALAVNGIASTWVAVFPFIDPDRVDLLPPDGQNAPIAMLIQDWAPVSMTRSATDPYPWSITLNLGDWMVDADHNDADHIDDRLYGDLKSLDAIRGQNTTPPSEKVFGSHFIVEIDPLITTGHRYYDPSYGVSYKDDIDFENKAIYGYAVDFGDTIVSSTTRFITYQVRRPSGKPGVKLIRRP
jgi:hypothetical protein